MDRLVWSSDAQQTKYTKGPQLPNPTLLLCPSQTAHFRYFLSLSKLSNPHIFFFFVIFASSSLEVGGALGAAVGVEQNTSVRRLWCVVCGGEIEF